MEVTGAPKGNSDHAGTRPSSGLLLCRVPLTHPIGRTFRKPVGNVEMSSSITESGRVILELTYNNLMTGTVAYPTP